ncbi:HNH endonuclease [Teredinibacter sp. KSP-S5-2]|uniref:HNH endonuclease n=1 Tax=Teredinibacter sp. KSP-S5-2 TaxID=3034506 RepID=UPI002935327B|nr:HNH endonuclease [Teredinibacter sp. KSP-S5-2]WNO08451.1 HNH endonuclease [Teredinibacter sp. KSP-S5-2]
MDIQIVQNLCRVLSQYSSKEKAYPLISKELPPRPLKDFHQWVNSKDFEGGFLIENPKGINLWLLLIKWNEVNGYYVVLFPEDRAGPIAEIHDFSSNEDGDCLDWRYRPSKRDGRNDERKEYFEKYFFSLDVVISLPRTLDEVSEFLIELISLAENRAKADELDPDKPSFRDGFPEGKVKERLHRSRERNSKLISQVKAEALDRYGKLQCECCGFDFEAFYGDLGAEFIEAHHTKPISELKDDGEETKREDIALVCSNCHRMLHRRRPWLKMNDLKKLTSQSRESIKHAGV